MQALPLGYTLPSAQSEAPSALPCTILSPHPQPEHLNGLPSLPRLSPRKWTKWTKWTKSTAHVDSSLWASFLATLPLLSMAQSPYFLSI